MISLRHAPFSLSSSALARVLVSLLLLITIVAPVATPLTVYADATPDAGGARGPTAPGPQAAGGTVQGSKDILDGCSLVNMKISTCLAGIFYFFFVYITGLFAAVAGMFFDVTATVSLAGQTYSNAFIEQVWVIARDLANMVFIFLLIFVAFSLILDIAHSGVAKQLAKIIAVALLINFSFFFTRVVIDASNILSHAFFDAINGRVIMTTPGFSAQPMEVKSLSENVLVGVSIQKLFDERSQSGGTFADYQKKIEQENGWINFGLLVSIFLFMGVINVILVFIFFTAGIQLLGRIIRLWIAIMLAPIGFIAWIIPGLGSVATRWWTTLLKAAFFAPAFMLGMYIVIAISTNSGFANVPQPAPNLASGAEAIVQTMIHVFLRFGFIIGLLFAALKLGDYMGQASSKAIISNFKKYGGMVGKYSGAGLGASYLVGGGAKALDKRLAGSRWGNTPAGYRFRQWVAKPIAEKEFFGTESASARQKRVEGYDKERAAGNRDIDNKEALKAVANGADGKTPKTKAEYEAFKGTAEGEASIAKAKAIIKNATARELEKMGIPLLTSLSHLQDEATVKRIDGIDAFSEADRGKNRAAWATKRSSNGEVGAGDAPINKIDEHTETIRKEAVVLDPKYQAVTSAVAPDQLITKEGIAAVRTNIEKNLDDLDTEKRGIVFGANDTEDEKEAKREARSRIDTQRRVLKKIADEYKSLNEERKKLEPGGTKAREDGTGAAETTTRAKAGEAYAKPVTPATGSGTTPPRPGGNNPPPPGGPGNDNEPPPVGPAGGPRTPGPAGAPPVGPGTPSPSGAPPAGGPSASGGGGSTGSRGTAGTGSPGSGGTTSQGAAGSTARAHEPIVMATQAQAAQMLNRGKPSTDASRFAAHPEAPAFKQMDTVQLKAIERAAKETSARADRADAKETIVRVSSDKPTRVVVEGMDKAVVSEIANATKNPLPGRSTVRPQDSTHIQRLESTIHSQVRPADAVTHRPPAPQTGRPEPSTAAILPQSPRQVVSNPQVPTASNANSDAKDVFGGFSNLRKMQEERNRAREIAASAPSQIPTTPKPPAPPMPPSPAPRKGPEGLDKAA